MSHHQSWHCKKIQAHIDLINSPACSSVIYNLLNDWVNTMQIWQLWFCVKLSMMVSNSLSVCFQFTVIFLSLLVILLKKMLFAPMNILPVSYYHCNFFLLNYARCHGSVVRALDLGQDWGLLQQLENSCCPPSCEWVPDLYQGRFTAMKGEDWYAQDTKGI